MTKGENQNASAVKKRRKSSDPVDTLVFLIPCLACIQIKLIGVLNGSDVFFLIVFIFLAFRRKIRIATPAGKKFLFFCSLWLVSQCVTDVVRHSAFGDYARGWSNIGITLVNFAVLCALAYGRPRRLVLYGWGLVTGSFLTFIITPDKFADVDLWKFAFSFPVTLAVFLFASRARCRGHWPITLSVLIGVLNIYLGSRSLGGVCLAAALYLGVTRFLQRKERRSHKLNTRSVVAIAASLGLGFFVALSAYQYAASTGFLGNKARVEYREQSSGRYGLLLGGRTDMLGAFPAIYDSPILGHGSWAKDPTYVIAQHEALAALGYENAWEMSSEDLEEGLIPAHSYMLQAWVDAGILGAFFFAWVFVFAARVLMRVYPPNVVLLPVMALVGLTLLWNILFSPYGAEVRIIFPYYVVMLMSCQGMAAHETVKAAASTVKRKIDATLAPLTQH